MDILAKTKKTLEWGRLKEFLASEAETIYGQELCLLLEPSETQLECDRLLDETYETLGLVESKSSFSFENVSDLRSILSRLKTGASLAPVEFIEMRNTLIASGKSKALLSKLDKNYYPKITQYINDIQVPDHLLRAIDQTFDLQANVKDEASNGLSSLRHAVKSLNNQIKDELSQIIQSPKLSKVLMEPLYTVRNNRYVLPVNTSQRSTIPGIVHDTSSSGLTVYIEPALIVELTNKLRIKEAEIDNEIGRILAILSAQAKKCIEEIESSFKTISQLDFISAKARLAYKYKGQKPAFSKDNIFVLKQARHPLLLLQNTPNVVANDIVFDNAIKTMIVTGPNTGGKTVILKTVGLLALMLRSGMLLPVASNSVAKFFRNIFADIGDDQSLEYNLSTFSSHMTNIVEIVENACPDTLVLLDEIGIGTDPQEGQALARAIIEHLNQVGALTIATTHYGELKTLSYSDPSVINAGLEFDEVTLSPTYKLHLGIPGSSKATIIASRLGLKNTIVQAAQAYNLETLGDVGKLTRQLENKLEAIAKEKDSLNQREVNIKEKEDILNAKLNEMASLQEKIRNSYANQIENEFKQAKNELKVLISSLQNKPNMQEAQKAQKAVDQIKKDLNWLEPNKQESLPQALNIGDKVRVKSLNQRAIVVSLLDNIKFEPQTPILVRIGNIKLKILISDLELRP